MTSDYSLAIVGMSGRFPGARDTGEFWAGLEAGVCSLTDLTAEDLAQAGVDPALSGHRDYVAAKGVLAEPDRFDADLFGFGAVEAAALDPQHRVLLETAWAALEDAGIAPRSAAARTGVYVGGSLTEHSVAAYGDPSLAERIGEMQVRLLSDREFLAAWISYRLALEGPSLTVQTACSTSLAAVHLAAQALLAGECDTALAGGVSIASIRRTGYLYREGGVGSPDGRCRPFDEAAAGTLSGDGAGIVVLRRLEDAIADGDPIRAVIRGSALTSDGNGKVGFAAPGPGGQRRAIAEAWAAAGLDPADAQYLEMHGTGTVLGDQVEIASVTDAMGGAAAPGGCAIGSVKSNIGHLDAAAGVAGLIKVVLMLEHGTVVPTVNVSRPHPDLFAPGSPLRLATEAAPWPRPAGGTRLAGVTSVGLGGTNVHVVLEEAPVAPVTPGAPARGAELLPLSAGTGEQVAALARDLAAALRAPGAPSLADTARTLQTARAGLGRRAWVVAGDRAAALTALDTLAAGPRAGVAAEVGDDGTAPAPVFLFSGQSGQYPDAGRQLYDDFPLFRDELDACADVLLSAGGPDPRPWRAGERSDTGYWQPALVALELAAVRLWAGWGITPAAVVGHSVGEYTAAVVSGVMDRSDALLLAAARGSLMERTAPGRMLAVAVSEQEAAAFTGPQVELAAVNGPRSVVLSGPAAAVEALADGLAAKRVPFRFLGVDRAFHSALMEPVLAEFAGRVGAVRLGVPRLPVFSTVTGARLTPGEAADPAYWTGQLRGPVRYRDAVAAAGEAAPGPLLELGPGNALVAQGRRSVPGRRGHATFGTAAGAGESTAALRALGDLWSRGHAVDWTGVPAPTAHRVRLPAHPFAGRRWGALVPAAPSRPAAPAEAAAPAPAEPQPVDCAEEFDDGLAARVTRLLDEALGLTGPDDLDLTYFAAGGDSLTAVQVVGRLRDDLGIEIPVTLLLEKLTIRQLVERVVATEAESREADDLFSSLLEGLEEEGGDAAG
ncbi:beta-ketoacyl synthase N-terminal-like domain-containing protein [Streptomyces sp. SL13]|uniref:Beta-ketoacyl synthase N-terminal-like domain-containing protein n=1 Tax=Streptantibioticus silvisoli TaxID=2705255 RepID=A0AA90KH40_9ACTN|nr:beta-ketoacyl synthase N-terminal-like domain-containing protein [Streptantibioticus silvisoli]MDI5970949.1 beta-ketoacyl synthase N-terminal-like domain-containing protein [Streptantibioticus silvisoli]